MMMVSFRPALGGVQQAVRGLSLPMLSLHCFLRSEVQYSFFKKLDVICTLWNMHEVQGTDFRLCALAWFILFHVLCTHRIQRIVVLHVCRFTLTINVTSERLYAVYWSLSSWQLPGCFSCYSTIENHNSYKINFVYLDLQTSSWAYLVMFSAMPVGSCSLAKLLSFLRSLSSIFLKVNNCFLKINPTNVYIQ